MKLLNKMKKCELCNSTATIHCDSDRANLCWTCDANVHSANFLVAKHLRNLLCHVCHSPTPWAASGEKLSSSTVSVCGTCVVKGVTFNDDKEEKVGCSDGTSCTDGFVIDNKPVPPAPSSSSSEEVFKGDKGVSMKRKRRNVVPDLNSEVF
nr:zinc finger protein CONSTANS-LIKE 1-like [Tanacetum cinerariifolium]